jgi:hypothetical protein
MTPQQIEAMKLALEALEACNIYGGLECVMTPDSAIYLHPAITALKARLADPMREVQRLGQEIEQEPVGMVKDLFTSTAWEKLDVRGSTKVYLDIPPQRTEQEQKPAQRKPLTDDLLTDLWYKQSLDWMEFARAIEAAHGIKENT